MNWFVVSPPELPPVGWPTPARWSLSPDVIRRWRQIVMPIFDRFAACIISLKQKPVQTIDDLKKVKIGSGTSDAGSKLFPVLMWLKKST